MSHLKEVARVQGCYKLILDCELLFPVVALVFLSTFCFSVKGAEKNVKFYEKLGFVRKELQMACYF